MALITHKVYTTYIYVYVCVYIYIYTYVCVYIHIYIHTLADRVPTPRKPPPRTKRRRQPRGEFRERGVLGGMIGVITPVNLYYYYY